MAKPKKSNTSNSTRTGMNTHTCTSKRQKRRTCWYDGSDPESREISCMAKFKCKHKNRKAKEDHTYLTCDGGCKSFHYCSPNCLRKDSHRHQAACQRIRKLRSDMDALYQNVDVMLILCSPSHEHVGRIHKRRTPAAFAYLCARMKLVHELYRIAKEYSIVRHWDELNSILQENLRLCHLHVHILPLRDWCHKFSTALLDCGRIDDSLSFTSYILKRTRTRTTSSKPSSVPGSASASGSPNPNADSLHSRSIEGQWIYPRVNNFDSMCTIEDLTFGDLYLVFVVYLCKLKQFMVFTLIRQAMDSFHQTYFGQHIDALQGPLGMILEYLVPFPLLGITTRETFFMHCDGLHANLSTMTNIIQGRNSHLVTCMNVNGGDFIHANQKGNGVGNTSGASINSRDTGQQKRMRALPASKQFAIDCIHKCEYSLRTIPDLDVWVKYCCERRATHS